MTTALNIPQDATTDTVFRCVKWSCVMAYRHCLRRQAEALQRGPLSKNRTPIPVHPYCANKCEDGQAIAERFGRPAPRIR